MQLEEQYRLLREIKDEISRLNEAAGKTRFNPWLTSELGDLIGDMDKELYEEKVKENIYKYS